LPCACHEADPIALPPQPGLSPLPGDLEVTSLALGVGYSCALLAGGAVKCWGGRQYGVLGNPDLSDTGDPSQIDPIDFGAPARAVKQVSAGWHHVCARFDDGHARCWGHNDRGQLGLGSTDDYGDDPGEYVSSLGDLPLDHIVDVSAGVSNTCAIVSPGDNAPQSVHCWGSDTGGGVGDQGSGDFGDDEPLSVLRSVNLPIEASLSGVAAGDSLGCVILGERDVRCWGNNAFGTLGTGSLCNIGDERVCEGAAEPRSVLSVQNLGAALISGLVVNQADACAIDNTGALRCWGRNDESRAGYPDAKWGPVLSETPGPLNLGIGVRAVAVGLGTRHGCALDARGDVRCWGEAGPQLGYGQRQMDGVAGIGGTLEPGEQYAKMQNGGVVQLGDDAGLPGTSPVKSLFTGGFHNCAIMTAGGVRCWGHNESGELGYGDYARVGPIGETESPADDYARLTRYQVCVVPAESGPCAPGAE
jgi:alpha-tubulin suppressor-like RCC1 family protein